MASLIPWKRRNEEKGGGALAERPRDVLAQIAASWIRSSIDSSPAGIPWPAATGPLRAGASMSTIRARRSLCMRRRRASNRTISTSRLWATTWS